MLGKWGDLDARRQTAVIALFLALLACGAPPSDGVAARDTGRTIYRDGALASGEPLTAVVEGDVPVQGRQLTCVGCHQRSGMGSAEGPAAVPPISGPALYAPTETVHPRPAYTDETLVRAIRDGVDAAGRSLDPLMPRYRLADADVRALVAYLKTLSAEVSGGVTEETVRFATIVTEGVDPAASEAMFRVLDTYFEEKNRTTRQEPLRARVAAEGTSNRSYRRWLLSRWTLRGPQSTWTRQLDEQYRREPVFAVIGGLAAGEWRPIHEFCERNELPCLLPNTDLPASAERDVYTLYFSQGIRLEARAIAEHLPRTFSGTRVVQVFGRTAVGKSGAEALRTALEGRPNVTLVDLALPAADGEQLADALARRAVEAKATAIVLWLAPDELAQLCDGWEPGPGVVYVSSTLLGGRLPSIPRMLRGRIVVAHPFALPGDRAIRLRRLQVWLTSRGGAVTEERIQAQTYFACLVLGDALMHMRSLLYRDYLLDTIDHGEALAALSTYYPRLGFGPGQRYLAKGCYLLELGGEGDDPAVTRATWSPVGS